MTRGDRRCRFRSAFVRRVSRLLHKCSAVVSSAIYRRGDHSRNHLTRTAERRQQPQGTWRVTPDGPAVVRRPGVRHERTRPYFASETCASSFGYPFRCGVLARRSASARTANITRPRAGAYPANSRCTGRRLCLPLRDTTRPCVGGALPGTARSRKGWRSSAVSATLTICVGGEPRSGNSKPKPSMPIGRLPGLVPAVEQAPAD